MINAPLHRLRIYRRLSMLLCGALLCLSFSQSHSAMASAPSSGVTSMPLKYGMWSWDQSILGDQTRIREMVEFCLRLGIDEISLGINWNGPFVGDPNNFRRDDPNRQGDVQQFLSLMHQNGIRVEWLVGGANWIYHKELSPKGGLAYAYSVKMIERFLEYQNIEYRLASASAPTDDFECTTCFDGIRLDVEPHTLRQVVTNRLMPKGHPQRRPPRPDQKTDPEEIVVVPGVEPNLLPLFNDGKKETRLYFATWRKLEDCYPGYKNKSPKWDDYGFCDTSLEMRTEIFKRYWVMLKRHRARLRLDRGDGHITSNARAVERYLRISADLPPWLWLLGADELPGFPEKLLKSKAGSLVGHPILKSNDPVNALVFEADRLQADKPLYQAILDVPDRIGLMGYRDRWVLQYDRDINGDGAIDNKDVNWSRSFRYWNEGRIIAGGVAYEPMGFLPYLASIGKPVSLGIEFIDGEELGTGDVSFLTLADDQFSALEEIEKGVARKLKHRYPNIEGIRYHEYSSARASKPNAAGRKVHALREWAEREARVGKATMGRWREMHGVAPGRVRVRGFGSDEDATIPIDPERLVLQLAPATLAPSGSESAYFSAVVSYDSGECRVAALSDYLDVEQRGLRVKAYVNVPDDATYFVGGAGLAVDSAQVSAAQNGALDASGRFAAWPNPLREVWSTEKVLWLELIDGSGHVLRRFLLDERALKNWSNAVPSCAAENTRDVPPPESIRETLTRWKETAKSRTRAAGLEIYDDAMVRAPNRDEPKEAAWLLFSAASLCRDLNDLRHAIPLFELAIEYDPDNPHFRRVYGDYLIGYRGLEEQAWAQLYKARRLLRNEPASGANAAVNRSLNRSIHIFRRDTRDGVLTLEGSESDGALLFENDGVTITGGLTTGYSRAPTDSRDLMIDFYRTRLHNQSTIRTKFEDDERLEGLLADGVVGSRDEILGFRPDGTPSTINSRQAQNAADRTNAENQLRNLESGLGRTGAIYDTLVRFLIRTPNAQIPSLRLSYRNLRLNNALTDPDDIDNRFERAGDFISMELEKTYLLTNSLFFEADAALLYSNFRLRDEGAKVENTNYMEGYGGVNLRQEWGTKYGLVRLNAGAEYWADLLDFRRREQGEQSLTVSHLLFHANPFENIQNERFRGRRASLQDVGLIRHTLGERIPSASEVERPDASTTDWRFFVSEAELGMLGGAFDMTAVYTYLRRGLDGTLSDGSYGVHQILVEPAWVPNFNLYRQSFVSGWEFIRIGFPLTYEIDLAPYDRVRTGLTLQAHYVVLPRELTLGVRAGVEYLRYTEIKEDDIGAFVRFLVF